MTITLVKLSDGRLVGMTVSDRWNHTTLEEMGINLFNSSVINNAVRHQCREMGIRLHITAVKSVVTDPTAAERDALEPRALAA